MNPIARWLRFNLVGAFGMAMQLSILAALHHFTPAHYLIDTAIAVELTLLHNFAWHTHYTWRDRRHVTSFAQQLLRFHLANGLISLTGNLILMRLFLHAVHLPLITANVLAIACCSIANFLAAHRWAFYSPQKAVRVRTSLAPSLSDSLTP